MPQLNDFPSGGTLFIDANIFLEHLIAGESSCTALFQRLAARDIRGVASVAVLAEVRHRLLLTAAIRKGYVTGPRRALEALRKNPRILSRLGTCDDILNDLLHGISIRIVSITPAQFRLAQRISLKHHLLTNDALHIASMRAHGIRALASADQDFRRIPRIMLWHP